MTNRNTLSRLALFAVVALLVVACPSFAMANEPTGGEPSIFDLPDRWDLSIYTLVVFGILFFLLSKFAWPQIRTGMKAREDAILNARDEAVNAKKEAEAIRADLQLKMAQAQDEVKGIIEEARRDAAKLRSVERETGVKEAASERDRAKREIETAKDQALSEIYQKSVQLAALMSSKALRREMTSADHSRLIDESLAELKAGVGKN